MSERSSGAGLGVTAAVAVVACCALPALIGAGVVATIGGVLRSPLVVLVGIVALAGAVVFARRGRRRHRVGAPPTEAARKIDVLLSAHCRPNHRKAPR